MVPVQPFSYQQSSHSCWITSLQNALIHLCGETGRVPHKISKFLYKNSSDDGTATRDMKRILDLVRKAYNLKVLVYRNKGVTANVIRRCLSGGDAVMICDTASGAHSILVTGIWGNELLAFDPSWKNVAGCDVSEKRFNCCPFGDKNKGLLNPHHNVSIHIDYLLKESTRKKERFVMGNVDRRSALIISRMGKGGRSCGAVPYPDPAILGERFLPAFRAEA